MIQEAQAVISTAGDMMNGAGTYWTAVGGIYFLQKYLKVFKFYQKFVDTFPGADKWAHRAFAGVAALIVSLGIHIATEGDATAGWTVHISIPNVLSLWHSLGDWLEIFTGQQIVYELSKPKLKA